MAVFSTAKRRNLKLKGAKVVATNPQYLPFPFYRILYSDNLFDNFFSLLNRALTYYGI